MRALPLGLPFQGRWLGEAGTERLSRICDNLSVCFADSIPTPFVPSGHFPLIGGIGPCKGSLRTAAAGNNSSVSLAADSSLYTRDPLAVRCIL